MFYFFLQCSPDELTNGACKLWNAVDLLIFIVMGFFGGLLGALFNFINKHLTIWRMKTVNTKHRAVRLVCERLRPSHFMRLAYNIWKMELTTRPKDLFEVVLVCTVWDMLSVHSFLEYYLGIKWLILFAYQLLSKCICIFHWNQYLQNFCVFVLSPVAMQNPFPQVLHQILVSVCHCSQADDVVRTTLLHSSFIFHWLSYLIDYKKYGICMFCTSNSKLLRFL